jgi:hypothetical protein
MMRFSSANLGRPLRLIAGNLVMQRIAELTQRIAEKTVAVTHAS